MPGQTAGILLTEIFKLRNWQNSLMYVASGKEGVKSYREMKAETVSVCTISSKIFSGPLTYELNSFARAGHNSGRKSRLFFP
jgi:hypothetical protein